MYNSVTILSIALKSLLFLMLLVIAKPAHASCASYATNGGTVDGYYLDNGCTAAINVYSPCEVVTNNTGNTLFVPSYYPGGSNGIGQNEWTSFITNVPAGVSVASCSCNLPWGGSLSPGQSATAYANASEPCHGSCSAETRTCDCSTTGLCVLSGSYTNPSCGVVACLPCSLPWGGQIADSQSVTAYGSSSVGCTDNCSAQTRSCDNGNLSGSYNYQSCTVEPCPCNLPWGGQINNGDSVTAYAASSVGCGGGCSSETRICSNGYLTGSYQYSGCSVDSCPCGTGGCTFSCSSCSQPWTGTTQGCNDGACNSIPISSATWIPSQAEQVASPACASTLGCGSDPGGTPCSSGSNSGLCLNACNGTSCKCYLNTVPTPGQVVTGSCSSGGPACSWDGTPFEISSFNGDGDPDDPAYVDQVCANNCAVDNCSNHSINWSYEDFQGHEIYDCYCN